MTARARFRCAAAAWPGRRRAAFLAAGALALTSAVGLGTGLPATAAVGGSVAGAGRAAPSVQASLPSNCSQASVGADVVCSFGYTGAEQTFTVPAGVASVTLTATGASGGHDALDIATVGTREGLGGVAAVRTTVIAGQTLYVEVGGAGQSTSSEGQPAAAGGFNGGGGGGTGAEGGAGGGGGGGSSDVRMLPASDGLSPMDSRLVVGGGGGGGCAESYGGNAGSPGGAFYTYTQGGAAGTLTAGGAGGISGNGGGNGGAGTRGAGGAGATVTPSDAFIGQDGGCGGGGGYYGGGGGSTMASGGGGSSYAPDGGTTSVAATTGNGSVTISFPPPPLPAALMLSPGSATIPLGGSQSYDAVSVDAFGATVADVTAATMFSVTGGGSCTAAVCTPPGAGTYQVTGTDGPVSGQAQLTESQGTPQVSLSVSPAPGATAASPVTLTATVPGVTGAPAPAGSVTFTESAGAGPAPVSCGGGPATVTVSGGSAACALGTLAPGAYQFGASYSGDANYAAVPATGVTGYQVSLVPTQAGVTSSVSAPVTGQPVTFTATVTDGGVAPVAGSVQWLVDGTDSGAPLPVSDTGTATLGPLSFPAGSHTVEADYSGTGTLAASISQTTVVAGPAATATSVSVTGSALTATVTTQPPGGGTPSGTVTFDVDGTPAGAAPLVASAATGTATATVDYASSGAETVSAAYGGSTDYLGSSASTATANPVIVATVTSRYPQSSDGWYRSPVTVTFACTPGSAPLATPCPAPVTLSSNGAAQSVTETISGTDGGIATVTVSPINIDTTSPKVTVTGAKNGASYQAPGPKLACTARDTLSGLAGPCTLTLKRTETRLSWTARATDKAGNTTKVTGKIKLIDFYIKGAALRHGRYAVTSGHAFTVIAYVLTGKNPPRYVHATRAGVRPHRAGPMMTSIGNHKWQIKATITTRTGPRTQDWNLGVLVGKTLHIVQILLRR